VRECAEAVTANLPVPVPEKGQVLARALGEDKRRYYLTARGSATESAALLDVCYRLKLLEESGYKTGKATAVRIVSMPIKLAQSCEE
jgi:hypothetical protein